DDPQPPHDPLLALAAGVHVHPRVMHGLEGAPEHLGATAAEALCGLEDAIAATPRFKSTFCARHGSGPPIRKHDLDPPLVGLGHDGHALELANAIAVLLGEDVVLVREFSLRLAGGGEAKALLRA